MFPFCLCTRCCRASLLARLWYHCSQWRFLKQCRVLTPCCCATFNRLSSSLCTLLSLFSCFWARVHPVHHQLVGYSRSQWQRSVARWWKGTAFAEKMNAEHEDEEFCGAASGHTWQNNDPPPEFTGTKPSEFKNYREKVRRWLLFTRTPAQLQGPYVLSRLTGPAWDAWDGLEPDDVATADGVNMIWIHWQRPFRVNTTWTDRIQPMSHKKKRHFGARGRHRRASGLGTGKRH